MKFILDECITEPVARALEALGYEVGFAPELISRGAEDDDIYRYAGECGASVLSQDREIITSKTKQAVLRGANCGVFVLRRPRADNKRLKLIRILTLWEQLEHYHREASRPFVFECRSTGIKVERIL